ncbi:cytochrome d ubiquinol oxidase subunit II [Candidatus Rhabdochlamydia sp. T3358]|uniref:cytochrome d ubiquinol oxidase subunit II n=1 Tax=Candidatus Rhabdochlamydia sp. T3358 TaxID=2099795 RepID=UPI0010B45394|nr:cytochrome d ubiquinol oxidase subunit II [Candidatus Rhabdochlamydia sp. T3358]VHO04436.1 Cytochrome bd-I ubiquinol oxidase subunit 2 [Candidatus Rhabdochlamydia sp. T3358]
MSISILQHIALLIFLFSAIAYATLDGFDLGVGCLHLFARKDEERRVFLNAIGPVWDGNSVWIVISTGILLAGFPKVFASLLSGLYIPMMLLVFGFMFRSAAMEFRSKKESSLWRRTWDMLFFLASLLISVDLGLILGNLIQGMPLNHTGIILWDQLHFMNPYAFLIACFTLIFFTLHGCLYLLIKTEGDIQKHLLKLSYPLVIAFLVLWLATTLATYAYFPFMMDRIFTYPSLLIFVIISLFGVFCIPYQLYKERFGWAFIGSCIAILSLMLLYAIGTYPDLIISSKDPENLSLSIFNSSSSPITLWVIFIVALAGAPLSIFYVSYVYKIFKGKVKLDSTSY